MNTVFPNIADYDPATGGVKPYEPADPVVQPSRWAKLRGKVAGWWARINLTMPVSAIFWIALVLAWALYSVFSVRSERLTAQQAQPSTPDLLDLERRVSTLEHMAQAQASAPPMPTAPPARSSASRAPAAAQSRQSPPQQAQPAEPPASTWGQTALDRAIADFKPATAFGATP